MFMQISKLSAAFHELSCQQAFLPYLAMVKNPKIQSCDLDLWPMTLKFSRFHAVVKKHAHAKLHPVKCSGSWVIVFTEKTRNWSVITWINEQYLADRCLQLQWQPSGWSSLPYQGDSAGLLNKIIIIYILRKGGPKTITATIFDVVKIYAN